MGTLLKVIGEWVLGGPRPGVDAAWVGGIALSLALLAVAAVAGFITYRAYGERRAAAKVGAAFWRLMIGGFANPTKVVSNISTEAKTVWSDLFADPDKKGATAEMHAAMAQVLGVAVRKAWRETPRKIRPSLRRAIDAAATAGLSFDELVATLTASPGKFPGTVLNEAYLAKATKAIANEELFARLKPVLAVVYPRLVNERAAAQLLQMVQAAATGSALDKINTTMDVIHGKIDAGGPGAPAKLNPSSPAILNQSFALPHFAGRERELADIHKALIGSPQLTAITGLAGVGKSALAREYARRHLADFAGVWWIRAADRNTLIGDLADLAQRLDPRLGGKLDSAKSQSREDRQATEESVARQGIAELRRVTTEMGRPFLLIFDNVDKPGSVPPWATDDAARVLMTSQYQSFPDAFATISLDSLSAADSETLLRAFTGREERDIDSLVGLLGGLPIALVQAGSYLRENPGESAAQYAKRLGQRLADRPDDHPADYPHTVAQTLGLTLEAVEKKAPGATALLQRAAFFAPDNIPLNLIGYSNEDDGARKAADALGRYSVWRQGKGELGPEVSLHRLLQLAARTTLAPADFTVNARLAVEQLNAAYPERYQRSHKRIYAALAPHTMAAARYAPDDFGEPLARMLDHASAYLANCADYHTAERCSRRAVAVCEKTPALQTGPAYIESLISLGDRLCDLDRTAQAEAFYLRGLALVEKLPDRNISAVAIAANNYGLWLQRMTRLKEAEVQFLDAISVQTQVYGPDDIDIGSMLTNIAALQRSTNRYKEAEENLERAGKIAETHPDLKATVLSQKGALYLELCRYEKAEALLEESKELILQNNGRSHPSFASALSMLARLNQNKGRPADAEPLAREALEIDERLFGGDHANVANDLCELADILRASNNYGEAEQLFKRAQKIIETSYGVAHPRRARLALNLGALYLELGRFAESKAEFERAVTIFKSVYGESNPSLASALTNLGQLHLALSEFDAAESMHRQALEIHTSSYGPNHVDVANDLNSLALVLREKGLAKQAEQHWRRAIEIYEAAFGKNDAANSVFITNLAHLLLDQFRIQEAETLYHRALAVCETGAPGDQQRLASALSGMSAMFTSTQRYADAEQASRRAMEIHKSAFGDTHMLIAQDQQLIGSAMQGSNRLEQAEQAFRTAIDIVAKVRGSDNLAAAAPANASLGEVVYALSRLDDAETCLRAAIDGFQKSFGASHPNLVRPLIALARVFRDGSRFLEAQSANERALSIVESSFGPDHPAAVPVLTELGAGLAAKGEDAKALDCLSRALAINERNFGGDDPRTAAAVGALANLHVGAGRNKEAEPLALRALAINETRLGADSAAAASDLLCLGTICAATSRSAQAEAYFRRALAINEKLFGKDHPYVAGALVQLGQLQGAARATEAEANLRRAMEIYEHRLGGDSASVGMCNQAIGDLLLALGRPDEAEQRYRRAQMIYDTVYGPEHAQTAAILSRLATLKQSAQRYDEAEALFRQALGIYEHVLGPTHVNVATILLNLALLLDQCGRSNETAQLYELAIPIYEKAGLPRIGEYITRQAESFRLSRRFDEAVPAFAKAIALLETSDADNPALAVALNNLAVLYLETGQWLDARATLERACRIVLSGDPKAQGIARQYVENLRLALSSAGATEAETAATLRAIGFVNGK